VTEVALRESILSRKGIERTSTSLTLPPDLTYDEYEQLLSLLGMISDASRWWLADALAFGELAYADDRYVQAAQWTGLSEQACMNYASLARRVPPNRRRDGVYFSLHQEVAPLPPAEQKAWLKTAEEEKLTKAELRARIKGPPEVIEVEVCESCGRPL